MNDQSAFDSIVDLIAIERPALWVETQNADLDQALIALTIVVAGVVGAPAITDASAERQAILAPVPLILPNALDTGDRLAHNTGPQLE